MFLLKIINKSNHIWRQKKRSKIIVNKSEKNVNITKKLDLCVSCEICSSICPQNAIKMKFTDGQFLPIIDKENCSDCSLCFQLCPGINIDTSLVNKKITVNDLSGICIKSYVAHSKNNEIRKNATSGGIVTGLIIELIKNKKYDEAFVLNFESFDGTSARLKSMSKTDEIINASKSKYIPASVKNIIESLKNKDGKRYIIVGTSCQIFGIKSFLKNNKISEEKLLFLGLFCDRTLNFNILRYFEEEYKKEGEKLVKFDYRNKDISWPGDCKLYFDSGRNLIVNRKERIKLKKYFQLNRCLFCLDKFNKLADISFGDCYIDTKTSPLGESVLIIRTTKGKQIFDEFFYLFEFEKVDLDQIEESQQIINKKQNLEYIRSLVNENDIFNIKPKNIDKHAKKELSLLKKDILLGKKYNKNLIKRKTISSKLKPNKISSIFFKFPKIIFTKKKGYSKKNIIIVGGGFSNKGAQAMVFTTVNQLKQKFPDKTIYLFSSKDYKRSEKEINVYNFKILPWDRKTVIKLLTMKDKRQDDLKVYEKEIKEVINNSAFFVDISGYALSSKFGFYANINYLLNIAVSRKFSIPFFILPQSVGPFNYNFKEKLILYPLMMFFLKYPEKIYLREKQGLNHIKKFTNKNVKNSLDIVLQGENYNLNHIFTKTDILKHIDIKPNSVGIVPNVKTFDSGKSSEIYSVYQSFIDTIINMEKNVYVFSHSSEDIEICKKIKSFYSNNDKVVLMTDDLNAIELENIIKQFDFIIASRYHSIIHAFKNGTPALVIGWADKYIDLLNHFQQLDYHIDVQKISGETANIKLNKMIGNYDCERECIIKKMGELDKENIFNYLG